MKLRWLTTNRARTDAAAPERHLRPRRVHAPGGRIAELLAELAKQPGWERGPTVSDEEVHLVHVTSLFKFRDDLQARLVPDGAGTRVELRSKSRIGRGDLGQNERNIAAVWDWLDRKAAELGLRVDVL